MSYDGLRYTLLTDGSSDRWMLEPIIDWLLRAHRAEELVGNWADLGTLPDPPKTLGSRLQRSLETYGGDLLIVHRDAETHPLSLRVEEIQRAYQESDLRVPLVVVVPIQMSEAWLLFDERAIRSAAGNPNGKTPLKLPSLREVERLDAKAILDALLLSASETQARRRRQKQRDLPRLRRLVAAYIKDFTPLRQLDAFRAFEASLVSALRQL